MEVSKVIEKRKSIRYFKKKKVPRKILKEIIKDAAKAPSSENRQPWEFHVVTSKKIRDKIAKVLNKTLEIYKKDLEEFPKKFKKRAIPLYANLGYCQNIIFVYKRIDKEKRDADIMSISCAVQNLMLSATNKRLGTCWIGTFRTFENEVSRILKIRDRELVAGILIGYPNEKPLKRKKKKLSEILRFV